MSLPEPLPHSAPSDTSAAAEAIVIDRLGKMSPADKLRRVLQLNEAVETLAVARLRVTYGPGASEREILLRLGALAYGRDLILGAFGWDPELEGW